MAVETAVERAMVDVRLSQLLAEADAMGKIEVPMTFDDENSHDDS